MHTDAEVLRPVRPVGTFAQAAWDIGVTIAGPAAADVDRDARFPSETRAALAEARLLSAMIPIESGGGGASLAQMSGAVRALATHCTSSALVLAMHTNEIAQLVRFGQTPELRELMQEISDHQLLVANANSEVGFGGDASQSGCALQQTDAGLELRKHALACSYGEHADLIAATARRSPQAEPGDQIYAILRRPELTLRPTSEWDTIGLRGTCSAPLEIDAKVNPGLVYPIPFSEIAECGSLAAWLILLASAWVGLAVAAAARAHSYVHKAARSTAMVPPSALRLSELMIKLTEARAMLASTLWSYERAEASDELSSIQLVIGARSLKVASSTLALQIATDALSICGIAGYRRSGPASLDRLLRDAHGSVVMVSNDRYMHANASILSVRKEI